MKMNFRKILMILMSLVVVSTMTYATDYAIIDVNLINQDPASVVAGDVVEVRFSVENIGTATTGQVYIEIEDTYPFEVLSENVAIIGSLLTGQNDENKQIVKFRLKVDKDASSGEQTVKVLAYENGNKNVAKEYEFAIDVKSEDNIEISKIDTTILVPGQQQTITFTILNVGSSNLNDLTFSWANEDKLILPVGADNTVHISSLKVGESIDIPFEVIASTNANADLYNLDLTISYENSISGNSDLITTTAGMYIGGGTDFDIVFDEQADGEYAFTIANIGANDATSVTVKVPSQTGWEINGRDSEIIGNLNKGDYTTTSFELTSKNSGNLKFNVQYTDTMGRRTIVAKEVIISEKTSMYSSNSTVTNTDNSFRRDQSGMRAVSSSITKATSIGKYIAYGVIILILAGVVVLYFKKRKKKVSKK